MHDRRVMISDVYDSPKYIDKAIVEARQRISRTHRVWPTCSECGKDLDVTTEQGFGKRTVVAVCPDR